jgi:cell division protease FtsH
MNPTYKNIAIWVLITIIMILLFNLFNYPPVQQQTIIYSEFLDKLNRGEVISVTLKGEEISGVLITNERFKTYVPEDNQLIPLLQDKGVRIRVEPREKTPWYLTIIVSWLPMVLLIAIWIFFMRQVQAGGGKAFSFGRSRAKLVDDQAKKITFKDVAGIDEAKEELEEIIDFLRTPQKFTKVGGKIPKGVLLVGAPGTGKTLLARAIAGEAGVPFFSISGSDFVEMFVGVGAARVRDLFQQAKRSAPCIIFIDEIDAVGRYRGAGLGGGHDEREQTLNQLLAEMDGFDTNDGVILIAATNRPDVLDPALLRPGRFDRQVVVPMPDVKGREEILKVHTKKIPLASDVDLSTVAKGTPGFAGADLSNLVNEAALLAARKGKEKVEMVDLEESKDKILMGKERRSMVISEEEKKLAAYHESGHALVAKLLPGSDPIHKVSIVPRGQALGVTQQLPLDEKHTYSKKYLLNRLAVLLGGRAAEELVFNDFTTGAGNDLAQATELARKMVCNWGMGEELGPLAFGPREEHVFLGKEIIQAREYSEETAKKIDKEVTHIVTQTYQQVRDVLKNHMHLLHKLAQTLLEKETIDGSVLNRLTAEGVV